MSDPPDDFPRLLAIGDRVRVIATGAAPASYQGKTGSVERVTHGQEQVVYTVLFDDRRDGFWTFPAWAIERAARLEAGDGND